MYTPKPVAYCILSVDFDKCEHIEYGVLDAPADAVMLYDQYVVERLHGDLLDVRNEVEYLRSQLVVAKQPGATTQATGASELPTNYTKHVAVKFMDGHVEHHQYSDVAQLDNAMLIAQVKKMFPERRVATVFVVEKS